MLVDLWFGAYEVCIARIDMLITDVGLPGVNGRDLAQLTRERRAELRVLFITGYAGKAVKGKFLAPGMDVLAKPVIIDAPAYKLRKMLAQV